MRESGKYGQLLMSTAKTLVSTEVATLNAISSIIGGKTYVAFQVATLAQKYVLPDSPDTPITVTLAKATGSDIPADIAYIIDYVQGRIIFNQALTTGNTVTVTYYYASTVVDVADVTEWSFDVAIKELDVTAFNDEYEVFIPLQKSWTGSITGLLNLAMFNACQGATDDASVNVAPVPVYFKLRKNRSTVSASNPQFIGLGLVSFSLKTPYAGKVEYTAKIRGVYGLSKSAS